MSTHYLPFGYIKEENENQKSELSSKEAYFTFGLSENPPFTEKNWKINGMLQKNLEEDKYPLSLKMDQANPLGKILFLRKECACMKTKPENILNVVRNWKNKFFSF